MRYLLLAILLALALAAAGRAYVRYSPDHPGSLPEAADDEVKCPRCGAHAGFVDAGEYRCGRAGCGFGFRR